MTWRVDWQGELRLLVLEHDRADAELNIQALRDAGFSVEADVIGSAVEFREHVTSRPYDVVIADYRLPSWTGMEALRTLQAMRLDIPLILVTGTLGDERAVECVKAGAADYILKENIGRLPIAVERAVLDSQARREFARAVHKTQEFAVRELEREEQFAHLADNISEVFYLVDVNFEHMLFINKAYETIWGRPTDSLYENPRSFIDGVHPDDHPVLFDQIARVQRGERVEYIDFRVIRPEGEIRWVTSRSVAVFNKAGAVDRISGTVLDITEQRLTRLAMEESEARFRKLVDAAFNAIVISQRGIVRECNRGFVEMFGLSTEAEAIGQSVLDFVALESKDIVEQNIREGAEGSYDFVGVRKDGRKITIEVTARIHDVDGQPGRISALRDVTHQRTLEEQFRQAQKMEAIGRLAGGVAHDFNNLLTVISSYAQLIRDDLGHLDPRREDADLIVKAAGDAASLTRQLLAFSRQEVIAPRRVVLQDLLKSSDRMLRRLIGEDVHLTTVLSDKPLMIEVDPGQFEQVIMNLAVNSRDAMPTGGKLTIETARALFDEDYADAHWPAVAGEYAMVAVSDTGAGMDAQTRARIFEPFFTTKEHGKGTGLGLATVYGIVKQAGGFIWVYTELGAGTTFKVYFPVVTGESTPVSVPVMPVHPRPVDAVILITEDAAGVRSAARRILERLGYSVLEASSGKDALDIARRPHIRIDVLMTDVVMPEMSGRELAEQFAAIRPETKVLYMSGYTDDAVLRHGVLSSDVEFLQKPFTPESLSKKLRAMLGEPDAQSRSEAP